MAADPRYNSWNFGRWSYLARSRYAEQLERWLELYPREQFLFLTAEEMFADPQHALDSVHEFLGLPRHRLGDTERLNVAPEYDTLPRDVRERIAEYFRPHNERLRELVGIDLG
jgi:hypothetical protein